MQQEKRSTILPWPADVVTWEAEVVAVIWEAEVVAVIWEAEGVAVIWEAEVMEFELLDVEAIIRVANNSMMIISLVWIGGIISL